jgi:hypothetical protein
MTESIKSKSNEKLSRRNILKTGAAAGLATVAGIAAPSSAIAETASESSLKAPRNAFDLDVLADTSKLDVLPSPTFAGQGPFYIPGVIYEPGTTNEIGKFHCWGFFIDNGAVGVVSQEFDLTGLGKIQVQGIEDEGARAVTGGTGNFRNVRGEMTGADLSNFPAFTATFRLLGAG